VANQLNTSHLCRGIHLLTSKWPLNSTHAARAALRCHRSLRMVPLIWVCLSRGVTRMGAKSEHPHRQLVKESAVFSIRTQASCRLILAGRLSQMRPQLISTRVLSKSHLPSGVTGPNHPLGCGLPPVVKSAPVFSKSNRQDSTCEILTRECLLTCRCRQGLLKVIKCRQRADWCQS